jgi:hypothetical protein
MNILASYIFDKRKTEWGYCKEFWGISKKDQLKENCFWDDWMLNAIEVYSEKEITNDEAKQIQMFKWVVSIIKYLLINLYC